MISRPLRLAPDNFTPASRTPWGGTRILALKAGLALAPDKAAYPVVGESWELSVDPAFPSAVVDTDGARRPLMDVVGPTRLLVKWLDAADNLSVQVHPHDAYAGLSVGESGKPEVWVITERVAGAGLYLGLAEGVTRQRLEGALTAGDDLRAFLNFVPVEPGDTFVIGPGTVHAVGAGVTLVEPQLVTPGRTGKTYRFWDWNRRYDAAGRRDPAGQPRALHVADSLAVTRFDGPRGAAFVATTRGGRATLTRSGGAVHERVAELCGMRVERATGTGKITLPARAALIALVVVEGAVTVSAPGGDLRARRGETCALPPGAGETVLGLEDAAVVIAYDGGG